MTGITAAHAAGSDITSPQTDSHYRPTLEQSCYRYGRCDADNPREERLRLQRLDRLAPQAPAAPRYEPIIRRDVEPTPEAELQPRYKQAGSVREEFKNSGSAVKAAP